MLLAIDTATRHASIALHDGETLRGECTWEAINRHTVTLVPHIQEMLEAVELTSDALTAVAVCVGPGSYTGVRIGVSAAQGLAITQHLPLVGVRTLDILVAAQPPDPRPLYALFAAGRKRVGYARYVWRETGWQRESEAKLVRWQQFPERITEPAIVVGEFPAEGRELLRAAGDRITLPAPPHHLRRAGFLAEIGWSQLRSGYQGDPARVTPIYAR